MRLSLLSRAVTRYCVMRMTIPCVVVYAPFVRNSTTSPMWNTFPYLSCVLCGFALLLLTLSNSFLLFISAICLSVFLTSIFSLRNVLFSSFSSSSSELLIRFQFLILFMLEIEIYIINMSLRLNISDEYKVYLFGLEYLKILFYLVYNRDKKN